MPNITNEDLYAKVCAIENEIKWLWKSNNEVICAIAIKDKIRAISENEKRDESVDNFFDQMADWALKEATRLKNYD